MLRKLAARGEVGRAQVIPEGLPPGSDVGNMSILGYDPARHHTGRAPIEAAALGLTIPPDKVAFRCNLVTVDDDVMVDFAGGHPDSVTAAAAIADVDSALGSGSAGSVVEFHPGVQYRHVMVGPEDWADAVCVPPHDIIGQSATAPSGPGGPELTELMRASRDVLGGRSLAANQVWLWGQGHMPQLPSFGSLHGVEAGLVTAVDLVRGLGVLAGVEVIEVPGATGWYDTNYEGKRDAAIAGLVDGLDLFLIHVEASDEAGHAGDAEQKIAALENWDRRILTGLVEALDETGPWRLLLLPDHATPLALRTHTSDPVPYLLVDSVTDGPGGEYTERGVARAACVPGHHLLGRLLG